MELHYKTTVWNKIKFNDDSITKEEIIKKLEKGYQPLDLGNEIESEFETMLETEEYITVEENDGQSTIELMENSSNFIGLECIWDNSYESELKRKQNAKTK